MNNKPSKRKSEKQSKLNEDGMPLQPMSGAGKELHENVADRVRKQSPTNRTTTEDIVKRQGESSRDEPE